MDLVVWFNFCLFDAEIWYFGYFALIIRYFGSFGLDFGVWGDIRRDSGEIGTLGGFSELGVFSNFA